MAGKNFYLTKEGLDRIKREYGDLRKIKLVKTKSSVPKIWQSEDLNPEYLAFQEDISFLESRIIELENIIKNAALIRPPRKEDQNTVGLGATVTLEEEDGRINEFTIVGSLEANPSIGKISNESPVGRVILGRKINDQVVITSPIKVVYKIKKIRYHSS